MQEKSKATSSGGGGSQVGQTQAAKSTPKKRKSNADADDLENSDAESIASNDSEPAKVVATSKRSKAF
eukprot:12877409-Alexandrium_andersonii.AAC.1